MLEMINNAGVTTSQASGQETVSSQLSSGLCSCHIWPDGQMVLLRDGEMVWLKILFLPDDHLTEQYPVIGQVGRGQDQWASL